ncbi:hypothetical protein Pve01_67010 [Planomonospora venezuelensis]|nr:hypothetical protein Pve01_67010 [Planomonospora venezuelensis]
MMNGRATAMPTAVCRMVRAVRLLASDMIPRFGRGWGLAEQLAEMRATIRSLEERIAALEEKD